MLVTVNLRRETTLLLPTLVVVLFSLFGIVLFRDFHYVVIGQLSVVVVSLSLMGSNQAL